MSVPEGDRLPERVQNCPTGNGPRTRTRGRGQRIVQQRPFRATLSSTQETQANTSSLSAQASSFQPGAETTTNKTPSVQRPRQRRQSKSKAADLPSRIHQDIDNRQYECPICTSEVLRRSKVWSCRKCWTVFHLDCVKKWCSNQARQEQQSDRQQPNTWRCPGCNLDQDARPGDYHCWCEKELNPQPVAGLPPHSCGQTCGKQRILPKSCPHPCDLLCHAGPCPPCPYTGPVKRCFCGKQSSTRPCMETNYDSGWSCGKPCGDLMPCGEHTCALECHEGLCGACTVPVEAKCYCGKEETTIQCCDRGEARASRTIHLGAVESWTGAFACRNVCGRLFDCGTHTCEQPCHAQDEAVVHCPRSPDAVTHCPCGKTGVNELLNAPRESCNDRIPNCHKVCGKALPCNHRCREICHTGECPPCLETVTLSCRCGRTQASSLCHEELQEAPRCNRVCHATMNCGRHECGEQCCAAERSAAERKAIKNKARHPALAYVLNGETEAEHICTRPCGKLLSCGIHVDSGLCHRGACASCPEAIFQDVTCFCGRTVLEPPLPCGTKRPRCQYSCPKARQCGHPQTLHECHPDDEDCPLCPFLTEKPCICGKKTIKNSKCGSEPRCGEQCGLKLKCGAHFCHKTCHRPGDCEDRTSPCQQPCGKPKQTCEHPCEEPCHGSAPCREENPCVYKTIITCPCQHKKQEVRCNASKNSAGNAIKSLKCDDECARLERNRKLAAALNIDPDHQSDHVPYSSDTLKFYMDNVNWATEMEREFRVFAEDADENRLRMKPMPRHQRAFLHNLSEDFGFDCESMDPEPHRHIALFKTPRFVSAPTKTLRDATRIRRAQAIAAATQPAVAKPPPAEPFNGYLLSSPRFGLTIDEIHTELGAVQGPSPKLRFETTFMLDGNVSLKAWWPWRSRRPRRRRSRTR